MQRTLSIVKPDAVRRGLTGNILALFENAGLRCVALRMLQLSKQEACRFYEVHRERPFYASLTDFMSSGPCVAIILEGEGAIARVRDIMGATDPAKAAAGTIRKLYAENIERNSVHGSDGPETAVIETRFFFSSLETMI